MSSQNPLRSGHAQSLFEPLANHWDRFQVRARQLGGLRLMPRHEIKHGQLFLWPEIREDLEPGLKPFGSEELDMELGCGGYGCVFQTDDPRVVLKITRDASEAAYAAWAVQNGNAFPGIVTYLGAWTVPGGYYALWREDVLAAGDVAMEHFYRDFLWKKFSQDIAYEQFDNRYLSPYFTAQQAIKDTGDMLIGDCQDLDLSVPSLKAMCWSRMKDFLGAASHVSTSPKAVLGAEIGKSLHALALRHGIFICDAHAGNIGVSANKALSVSVAIAGNSILVPGAVLMDPGHALFTKGKPPEIPKI